MALSERERRFVEAYIGKAEGNATNAAIAAGYKKENARQQASRLLTKANIKAAIDERTKRLETASIADAKERREILSRHARSAGNQMAAIKAVDVLNKMDGVYIERLQHEGGIAVDVSGARAHLAGALAVIAARTKGRVS